MAKKQLRIARLFGIPISVDPSWFLIFLWVTWSLAQGYYPDHYASGPTYLFWILGIATSLLFFGSVLMHELGHALVARWQGEKVDQITLFIFGGMAEIADEPGTPKEELRLAIIGPLVSLALSGVFGAAYLLLRDSPGPFAALCLFLAEVNVSLGLFNLIPGFPLDGGRVLRAVLWQTRKDLAWATRWTLRVGQIVAFGFIGLGMARSFGGQWANGLWLVFIGLFMDNAARGQQAQTLIRRSLEGAVARDVMSTSCTMVPAHLTLDVLVDQYLLQDARRCLVVAREGKVQGLITVHRVRDVPKADWPTTRVLSIIVPLDDAKTVELETPLWSVLRQMTSAGVNQLPVLDDGELVGMITREDLVTYIQAHWQAEEK